MNIRLIATDMDGTLLNNDHTINPAAKKKLIQAQERGIHIVLISGRDSHSLMPYAKELEMDRHPGNYLSCLNGLVLYDLDTQQEQRLENLKLPAIETVLQYGKKHHYNCIIFREHDFLNYLSRTELFLRKIKSLLTGRSIREGFEGNMRETRFLHDFVYPDDQPINKMVFCRHQPFRATEIKQIQTDLDGIVEVMLVGANWIEMMPPGVNKGRAIKEIAKRKHLGMDEIMAFGDAQNDISMMEAVKYGICMANGMPETKEKAYAITDTNENDGIAKAIEQYLHF